jgi:oligoribonuclease (3'-5' exoribonuclease)
MKCLVVDIETTGTDIPNHQILEIGAIVWDTVDMDTPIEYLDSFHTVVRQENLKGDAVAFAMNAGLIARIANKEGTWPYEASYNFYDFVKKRFPEGNVVACGKNVQGFDVPFLKKFMRLHYTSRFFSHRTLEVGSVYFDPFRDEKIPSLQDCLKRAGLDKEVAHEALQDCADVIRVLRSKWQNQAPSKPN